MGYSTLKRRTPLKARRGLGNGKPLHPKAKALKRAEAMREGHPKRFHPATPKARKTLRKVGRRGIKLNAAHRRWRKRILDIHGEKCIWPFSGECKGHIEAMHAYSRGAHPEWRTEPWNGFPGCSFHHRLAPENFEETPALKRALQVCADEMRAAAENKRPQPTWTELQDIIVREYRRRKG